MTDTPRGDFSLSCPLPIAEHATVQMAHGGGGRLMKGLIDGLFLPAFRGAADAPSPPHDSAVVEFNGSRLALTTDSFVVKPLFFPGGSIGYLAVYGTVNDLAMAGAQPLYLSAGFILEEGFPVADLRRVVGDMQQAAAAAGVQIVTGDTKVVEHGKGDGVYINTAGVGVLAHDLTIEPASVRPGDAILLSGDIARHGIAIMSVREGLQFETAIASDCAPLADLVGRLLAAGVPVHCLRDLTRGGLAAGVIEIAQASGLQIELHETMIPVRDDVLGACEILGFDPLYVANEGRCVSFVPAAEAEQALALMRAPPAGAGAAIIGHVADGGHPGLVTMTTVTGTSRVVDLLSGEQLPRIC
jgi:hydrogenase expression/formation protein HypE